ncbi:HNH endonuclease family protein [Streptomyces sp. NPDC004647]|uniref:HNH endonuclease family protein n=1 Tax=Streptomyces sp. NPDC004647 TaxID=3154671 RepID=UPI0033BD923D
MIRTRRTALPALALASAALFAVTGCTSDTGGSVSGGSGDSSGGGDGTAEPSAPVSGEAGSALKTVGGLTVKGRAPRTGYDRERFGSAWADTDSNNCRTREDILKRDLDGVTFRDGKCVVVAGTLAEDPYTGERVEFERGRSEVDIDHLVALSDAWQKGAQQWPPRKRIAFANDPLNLLAVDASTNRSKSDGDTATWLPPNKAFRCTYVAGQVAVKTKYRLWVTDAEKDAMRRVLSGCPEQKLPTGGNPTEAPARFTAR